MIISEDDYLAHYGILRRSGRYPWGSGGPEHASNAGFISYEAELKRQGLSEVERAKAMDITVSQLRAAKSIAKNEEKAARISQARRLSDHGYGASEIGRKMGIPESSVRSLLAPGAADRSTQLTATSNALKNAVDTKGYIDIGSGVEHYVGVSENTLKNSVAVLKEQGYEVHNVKFEQLGTGKMTEMKILAPPGTTQKEIWQNRDKITQYMDVYSVDGGRSFISKQPPLSISSDRVGVTYAEQGGSKADGVIYVRPGVKDISMGAAPYAQVRIAIDGTHYLKGMAVYKDDLPKGVDLMFNTNKSNTGNKLDAMKKLEPDPELPFGSLVRQRLDPHTGKVTSALNIIGIKEGAGEAGAWDRWSNTLSSQFLSKQSPKLAKDQLDQAYSQKKADFDEIMSLTNPTVKKKLLESFADGADSAALHLKAAMLPRQRNQVILPINSLKETEVYAPNFRNGERVVLVRFPHGGTFEIPELTVNNNNPEGKKYIGTGENIDAVGIHHKVAEQLSGADFDGDTVLVIPNNSGKIKTKSAFRQLVEFDPKREYPGYEGMNVMKPKTKGIQMGTISNLITDMTIKGASDAELIRAVKHSMVVIDAEKHKLNYRQSYINNGISALQKKYQGDTPTGKPGASTIISRKGSTTRVPEAVLRKASKGGSIDPETGKLVWEPTGKTYEKRVTNKRTGEVTFKTVPKTMEVKKLAVVDNAHDLSSHTEREAIYADHSNAMKALANIARQEYLKTPNMQRSPSAAKIYSPQVKSLGEKLTLAQRNRPLERQAQLVANTQYNMRKQANPNMEPAEVTKIKAQLLNEARRRMGASKPLITIEPDEWKAIQAGAVSNKMLTDVLNNADLDVVRALATPRPQPKMTNVKVSRARAMLAAGETQADVADALGVSVSTLKSALNG